MAAHYFMHSAHFTVTFLIISNVLIKNIKIQFEINIPMKFYVMEKNYNTFKSLKLKKELS